jgi:hypothetical protein
VDVDVVGHVVAVVLERRRIDRQQLSCFIRV